MNIPTNNFFVTGGTLRHDAPSYVERQADHDLHAGLVAGEFCYVLTSRQMGKSSLMVRAVKRLRAEGASVAVLDLTAVGQNLTPEQWYDGLMARLGQQLDLEDELLDFWRANPQWGPLQRWLTALEKIILPELKLRTERQLQATHEAHATPTTSFKSESRLIVFIDEIDVVRSLPFSTDEFFAALRECYNRRTNEAAFNRLTFCLIGVATPSDLIRETRMTPFNIGRRIELTDFTESEAMPLESGLRSTQPGDGQADAHEAVRRILHWTGGHPYLTQRLCRAVAENCAKADGTAVPSAKLVDHLCNELFLCSRAHERDDNLIFVRERLLNVQADRASLLHLYARVRGGKQVADDETNTLVNVLCLAGITRVVDGTLRLRNRIYSYVFDLRWVAANMPDAELRRQREAFRRGVTRTVVVGVILFLLLAAWLINSLRSHNLELSQKLDGKILTLEAVLPSTKPFEFGAFRAGLFNMLPIPFRKAAAPRREFRFSNPDEGSLVAWFTRKDPEENRYLNLETCSHVEILDEHGCRMINWTGEIHGDTEPSRPLVLGGRTPLLSEDSSVIVGAIELRVFPRSQKTFTLKFLDGQGEAMASFVNVPNPAYVRTTDVRPELLPATHRDGDLAVTLKNVTLELERFAAGTLELRTAIVKPEYELSQKGQPTEEWQLGESMLVDAGGNRVRLPVDSQSAPVPMLCLRESAWRLRTEFFRKPDGNFSAQDSWKLGKMTIPPPGTEVPINQTNRLHNLSLRLLSVGGGTSDHSTNAPVGFVRRGMRVNDLRAIVNTRTYFALQISGRTPMAQITLRIVDSQGRPSAYAIESPREGVYQILTDLPAGERLNDLSLIVQEPRVVAFAIKPPTPLKP